MNEITQSPERAMVETSFKNEGEVREYFANIINNKLLVRKVLFGFGAVVGLAVLLPIIGAAVMAGLGLAALAVLLVGAGVANRYLPVLWQKVENHVVELQQREANRHLAALKAEARNRPVEQLQNYLLLKKKQLKAYQEFVSQIGAQVKSAKDMLDERKQRKPGRDYSKKDQALVAMNTAYKFHLDNAEKGRKAMGELVELVDDAKFDHEFGKVGQAAMQQMQALEGQDLLNEMLAAESFASVRENFNKVFSEIEVQIGHINSAKQLDFGEGVTLDVSGIHIPTITEIQHD